jgi:HAD superfamily hydrolase (TIGR01509 family)
MSTPRPRVETVLCDADGCLFASEEPAFAASAQVSNELLEQCGIAFRYTAGELRARSLGRNFRAATPDLLAQHGVKLSPAELDSWVLRELEAVSEHLGNVLKPDPAVSSALEAIGKTHDLALVSSSASSRLDRCLHATGLATFFAPHRRFSAEDSLPQAASKPDPAVYLLALDELDIDARTTLAIEDSVAGARSAIAAGIPTLGNLAFVPERERTARIAALTEAGVDGIVVDWSELALLLELDSLDGPISAFSEPAIRA